MTDEDYTVYCSGCTVKMATDDGHYCDDTDDIYCDSCWKTGYYMTESERRAAGIK